MLYTCGNPDPHFHCGLGTEPLSVDIQYESYVYNLHGIDTRHQKSQLDIFDPIWERKR